MDWLWQNLGALGDLIEHHIGAITAVIAGAAVFQWRETRLTAERQLRAYVLNNSASLLNGSTLDIPTFVDRKGQPCVILLIKNHGQTPAYSVKHWAYIDVAPVSQENRMSVSPTQDPHAFILGPDGTGTAYRWLDRPITAQEETGIQNGSYAIYAFGRIEYVDAFKRPRWSTYRLKYTHSAWPPMGTSTGMGMDFCNSGNDAN